ncbi:rod shape-determining protein [Paractinoplanes rishiriensis]|uniref:rod shape-determining protein n=1 Tax=Paractinoplanes rishiriensis TaxID=1050105 RepID=UPI0019442482|nr:rod shape-determining protein [Actinoplanes rishiriensis]
MPANLASPAQPAGQRRTASAPPTTPPAAVAVDLGSSTVGVWAAHRGTITGPCGDALASTSSLVRRGRVLDVEGCISLLSQLIRRYYEPVPAGAVVAACRPVLASEQDQAVLRHVLEAVFAPTRLVFIDTVRAAAIGCGAAAGTLLIADLGAQLTEVALLKHGRVVAARRAEIGTRDLARGGTVDLIAEVVARRVADLRGATAGKDLAPAISRGMLLVGDGAVRPDLGVALSTALRLRVQRGASPRAAALNGAGLAAMSLLPHPTQS